MNKNIYCVLILVLLLGSNVNLYAQNSNVGIGTNLPDASAIYQSTFNFSVIRTPLWTFILNIKEFSQNVFSEKYLIINYY